MHQHLLTGPDGCTPIGFMMAAGVLGLLTRSADPPAEPRLHWEVHQGAWRPVLSFTQPLSRDDLVDTIFHASKQILPHSPAGLIDALYREAKSKPNEIAARDLRALVRRLRASNYRAALDLLASILAEVGKDDKAAWSPLVLGRGQGSEYFLKAAAGVREICTREDIERALFGPWMYAQGEFNFRWDPLERREYALMHRNPSDLPKQVEPGANLLALEGMLLFSALWARPGSDEPPTVGFDRSALRWPLWRYPASLEAARSLVRHPDVRRATEPDAQRTLQALGVCAVVASQLKRFALRGSYKAFSYGRIEWQSL